MISFIDQHKVDILIEAAETPTQGPSTTGRPIQVGGVYKGQRVVKNKARDLAIKGSARWNNAQRQDLIDNHARFETWESVVRLLDRSNQALRSEWNKMKNGQRENEGNWKEKVKVCEARRAILLSTKMTAPAAVTHETDTSGPSSRTATTTRSPDAEISTSTT